MNIYEKLQQARVELQESGLKKSGYNKFANFDYFELKDFLPKINEIFLKLKLFSKFDLLENEGVLTIINAEKPDEKEKFVTPKITVEMKEQNGLQQIGSTHTYLKRYCYYNALEIIINDEVDATIDKDKSENQNSNFAKKQTTKTKKETSKEEEKIKKENGIKEILKEMNNLSEEQQNNLNLELIELENYTLDEIRKLYKKIITIKNEKESA